ncbi:MAG: LicD family protein [Bacteroidaceae bacterium]|nr:LicD family protein [Bacteroidaceae bacterium]
MRLFHQTMELAGIEYTLAFGTLLGAVREKGFIAHDLDIDVAVWHSQQDARVRTVLETAGFAFSHSFEVDGGELGREETYIYNGVAIDIFYFYPSLTEGGLPYCCDFLGKPGAPTYRACMKKYGGALPRRVELPMERNRELVPFADLRLFIPTNADEILSSRYGDDYMTPNPGWGITSHDAHIVRWEEKLGIYKEA